MGNFYRALIKSSVVAIALSFTFITSGYAKAPATCRSFFADPIIYDVGISSSQLSTRSSPKLSENNQLKIVTWNMLLLSIPKVDSRTGVTNNWAISELAKAAKEIDADVYVIQEVSRIEALRHFVKKYLDNEYEIISEWSNTPGSQIGFLVKKSLDADFELRSHKDITYTQRHGIYRVGEHVFVRDLPALYLRQKDGSNTRASDDPDLVVLGAHFKSKLKTRGDPGSAIKREDEAQMTAVIVQQINRRFNGQVPIVLGGDFNTEIMESKETQSLRFVLKDSLALMGSKLTEDQKVTHTWHPKDGVHAQQIDGLLVNEAMSKKLVDAHVYHYRDSSGKEKTYSLDSQTKIYPLSYKQRSTNPSDHMPIIGIYDMTR